MLRSNNSLPVSLEIIGLFIIGGIKDFYGIITLKMKTKLGEVI